MKVRDSMAKGQCVRVQQGGGVLGVIALFDHSFQFYLVRIKCKGVNLCTSAPGIVGAWEKSIKE